jgi:hypothetical protein
MKFLTNLATLDNGRTINKTAEERKFGKMAVFT